MESSEQIHSDLKAVLAENHTSFELLHSYRGVPVICRAVLQKVINQEAVFLVRMPEVAVIKNARTTQILSDGLLEPIEAHISSFDPKTGIVELNKFAYAGSRISNRKELRVEPGERVEVTLTCDELSIVGQLVDISMRGIGLHIPLQDYSIFCQNKPVELVMFLSGNEVRMPGRIRNVNRGGDHVRLAVEFTGAGPEKSLVVRYILQRRTEIYKELQEIFAAVEK